MELSTSAQVGLSWIALGNLVSNGMSIAFPSVAIPALNQSREYQLEPYHASWIASLPQLSMILGSFLIGPIVDSFGRRIAFVMSVISSLTGWVIISFGTNMFWIYSGRLLTGLSMGFSNATTSVFLAEISSPSLRGPITVGKIVAFSTGVTIMSIIGWMFKDNWSIIALVAAVIPTLTLILTLRYLPESKIWKQSTAKKISYGRFFTEYRKRREVYVPFNIMNLLVILRHLSGTSVILTYSIDFLSKTYVDEDKVYQVAVAIGVSRIVFGLVAAWLSKKYGRRKPTTFSGAVMSLTMMGFSLYLQKKEEANQTFLVAFILVFIASSTIFSGITLSLMGEIFPLDVRGVCTGLTSCTTFTTAFVVLMTFPWLSNVLDGKHLVMVYATFSALSSISTIIFLPETHGKTLDEIKGIFSKNVGPIEPAGVPLNATEVKEESK